VKQRREHDRNMCAELLAVQWTDVEGHERSEVVSLEDISTSGACIEMDDAIPAGTEVSLRYPNGEYKGKIRYCIYQDIGYFLGIEFDEGYRWSKTDFVPAHLLELPIRQH
jgi:hypothetical protein